MKYIAMTFILSALLALHGCAGYDYRRDVAYKTLVNEKGVFEQDAYEAALKAKFPIGSEVGPLRKFVEENRGTCAVPEHNKQWCNIPVQGGVCWSKTIGIEIPLQNDKILDLRVQVGGLSC